MSNIKQLISIRDLIKIWDLITFNCIKKTAGHSNIKIPSYKTPLFPKHRKEISHSYSQKKITNNFGMSTYGNRV